MEFSLRKLTIQSTDVFHSDFAVTPHGTDNGVKFLALEATEGHTQILSVNNEG